MDRVQEFLGIDAMQHDLSQEDLENLLDSRYPKFEETSGWMMNGTYGYGKYVVIVIVVAVVAVVVVAIVCIQSAHTHTRLLC